ncbi:MAG: fatty acid desaturase [Nitrospina sp.]|nr:fatty acid desaturase [Nitrospina sp.]
MNRTTALTQQINEAIPQMQADFQVSQARELVKDLFRPSPVIYWFDFLCSALLGWGAFGLALSVPPFSYQQILFVGISCLALYRAVLFIHEIAHFKKGTFTVFRWVWNLFCGFPLMVPVFLYQSVHFDHHKQNFYGTQKDGEYFPFALKGRNWIVIHVLFSFVVPIIFLARFSILAPLSLINKELRKFLLARMSALVIDLDYQRPESSWRNGEAWEIQEFLACLFAWVFIGATMAKIIPAAALFLWYCVTALIFMVNSIRTLAAHRYQNPEGNVVSHPNQMLDSVNIPGNRWTTPLWAPVGLRFHATHHLFPDLPYHVLEEAHRRLIQDQGDDSLYGQTVCSGLLPALIRLWKYSDR